MAAKDGGGIYFLTINTPREKDNAYKQQKGWEYVFFYVNSPKVFKVCPQNFPYICHIVCNIISFVLESYKFIKCK